MDFARKQLEKYGWTDGKGLGKHENGISQALKPKLKRSATGVGYDVASDFTEHWWSALYDKAAKNVEVEERNGKTKKIKAKENEFEITNSTWRMYKNPKKDDESSEQEYGDFFVRTDTLTGGKSKRKKVHKESGNEDDKNVVKLTDEELFAACEGRTAHKGARHGLKALGKLARIEQQEQLLLTQTRFKGYSHAKNIEQSKIESQVFEDMNLNSDCDSSIKHKKKKRKKRCNSSNDTLNSGTNNVGEYVSNINQSKRKDKKHANTNNIEYDGDKKDEEKVERDVVMEIEDVTETKEKYKSKKKRNGTGESIGDNLITECVAAEFDACNTLCSKKRKKKS